ncbi:hypothetical protein L207DRAFT_524447 [Hyaloscypha variabilis F]|uniref:Uncharacterized protein n=1 Tax=Hyaloscypha variabilis (strain UAMH 11265 / GT02V1 / F) TaxID=1149755 RepID=A0A2J6S2M2_HYAVF|nr:hypothetical protein L207DRAFT_524447 [Hyaloscypha variabilis F]
MLGLHERCAGLKRRILITCDRKRWFWRFFWPGGDFKTVATYIIPDERQCILETEIPRKAYVPELTSFQLQSPNVKLSYHELENSSNMRLPSLVAVAVLFFAATSLTAPTPGPGSDIARREAESHAVIEANSVKTKRTQHSSFQPSIGTKPMLGDDDEGYGDAARIVERDDDEGYGDAARIVERS